MADRLTPQRRSWNMSRIKGKNTKPEVTVRRLLHQMRLRFRLHVRQLPGCPDIVLARWKSAIFVHGCFWHRHGCKSTATPKSNTLFWQTKFDSNVARDEMVVKQLRASGWRVLTIWACDVKDEVKLKKHLERFFAKTTHTVL
jgi:DNA mismatch endonuclease, patch repair protein